MSVFAFLHLFQHLITRLHECSYTLRATTRVSNGLIHWQSAWIELSSGPIETVLALLPDWMSVLMRAQWNENTHTAKHTPATYIIYLRPFITSHDNGKRLIIKAVFANECPPPTPSPHRFCNARHKEIRLDRRIQHTHVRPQCRREESVLAWLAGWLGWVCINK
jgi:hypothetical protein